jgi:hypothetical protein
MKISRRKFIEAAPVFAGAVMALKGDVLAQVAGTALRPGQTDGFARLSSGSFLPYINTDFTFLNGGNEIPLKLVDLTDTAPFSKTGRVRAKGQEAFILTFTGPAKLPLTQGTYRVNHFAIGDFEIFITEGATKGRSRIYFAVVNRIIG